MTTLIGSTLLKLVILKISVLLDLVTGANVLPARVCVDLCVDVHTLHQCGIFPVTGPIRGEVQ